MQEIYGIKIQQVREIMNDPSTYIESKKFFSWERFFNFLLIDTSKDTYLKYTKNQLNEVYLNDKIQKKFC